MPFIVTATEYFGLADVVADPSHPAKTNAEAYHLMLMDSLHPNTGLRGMKAQRAGVYPADVKDPSIIDKRASPAVAFVSWGAWLAECPDCGGTMFASPDCPFMCASCFNGAIEHRYRTIAWPKNRAAIEAVLLARPVNANRNWLVTETVEDLLAENVAHGVPALEAR